MANKAMSILQHKGLLIRVANSRAQEHISPSKILAVKVAFVGGSGKYDHCKARLRRPHNLPCRIPPPARDMPDLTWWPVVTLTFDDEEERRLARYMMDEATEDIEFADSQLDDDADLQLDVATSPAASSQVMCKALCVTCQEQIQWDPPVAWWFPTRSSM